MKLLTIMRHGKAANFNDYEDDFERPLLNRGKAEVEFAISALRLAHLIPTHIVCSPANRTASTARIAARVLDFPEDQIVYFAPLYLASTSKYLEVFLQINAEHLLIIGHNPAIAQLAHNFSEEMILSFPTSGIMTFEFDDVAYTHYNDILNDNPRELFKLLRD